MKEEAISPGSAQEPGTAMSRRRLLKLLAASGAVVGLDALLPVNWITPQAASADVETKPELCELSRLDLNISKSIANLVDEKTNQWNVSFAYVDNAGFLSETAYLTAYVYQTENASPQSIYSMQMLGSVGGLQVNSTSNYDQCLVLLPNSGTHLLNNSTEGRGYFLFNYPDVSNDTIDGRTRIMANTTLEWYLEQPSDRQGNTVQNSLTVTSAITLDDLIVEEKGSTAAAAAAAAALLGAATVKVLRNGE